MIEEWMPAIFAIVIVIGMVTARAWKIVLSEGLPMLRDWAVERIRSPARGHPAEGGLVSRTELAGRIERLEDQVDFLESLLQRAPGPSTPTGRDPATPSRQTPP